MPKVALKFIIVWLFVSFSIIPSPTVNIKQNTDYYSLGLYLDILEDKQGNLTIEDVQKPEIEKQFFASKWKDPNFGFTKSVYWFKFQLQSEVDLKDYWLEITYPPLDQIDFYFINKDQKLSHEVLGDKFPFQQRKVFHRNYILELKDFSTSNNTVYVRIETEGSVQFPASIWHTKTLFEEEQKRTILEVLTFGIILAMVLYNLFLYISIRDKDYLLYLFYIIFLNLYVFTLQGYMYQYLWPNYTFWNQKALVFFASMTGVGVFLFTVNFLKIKENSKVLYSLLLIFGSLDILNSLLCFYISYKLAISLAAVLFIFISLSSLISAIILVKKGFKPAQIYLLAWTFFLGGAILFNMNKLGILPKNITESAGKLGMIMEAILISIALGSKINLLQEEKNKAQQEALESMRKADKLKDEFLETLEKKVHDRTEQLNQTLNEVNALKEKQDGDYFLTNLILKPLFRNDNQSSSVKTSFLIKQYKQFSFKKRIGELGGDICITGNLSFYGKPYTIITNADAMGKSMQGAGGSIVFGTVMNDILTRFSQKNQDINMHPGDWLKEVFENLDHIFLTFNGSMLISSVIGLLDDTTGMFYFFNAEHPQVVLYRDGNAEFLEKEPSNLRKIGSAIQSPFESMEVQLEAGDILFIGSDGRDDLNISQNKSIKIVNEDETLFLRIVERSLGNLEEIYENLQKIGDITDDISLIRVDYKAPETE